MFSRLKLKGSAQPSGRGGALPRWISFAVLPFVLSLSLSLAITAYGYAQSVKSPQLGAPPKLTHMQLLMGLSDLSGGSAPNFTLTDQNNRTVSLNDFRGKAVLLAFMDSRCTTICPVIAQEIRLADHYLGPAASRVAFVAVNVNPLATAVSDVATFGQLHGLAHLPNWYFLTGTGATLMRVAKMYGIEVIIPKNGDPTQLLHADYLYFLTPQGKEDFMASPSADQNKAGETYLPQPTLDQWGHGIATYLQRVLAR